MYFEPVTVSFLTRIGTQPFVAEKYLLMFLMPCPFTGKDATDDFEDVGHSTSARAMMDEFYVGDIGSSVKHSLQDKLHSSQAASLQPGQDIRVHHQATSILSPPHHLGCGRWNLFLYEIVLIPHIISSS